MSARGEGGAARCPLCSQNAHNKNVLVRCAQWRATLATPLTRDEEDWKALAPSYWHASAGQWVGG
jgi:hypothetical protein